jgi:nucleotide-binding universal stress UspA family protein
MIALKKILVGTDFSEPSNTALEYGRHLARTFGSSLHVLHVVESVSSTYYADAGYIALPDLQQRFEEGARHQLAATVTDDDRQTLQAVAAIRTSTSPAGAIVEYARGEGIDLIVVGTHGRGGVSRILIGSVAERVVRTAPCPVLTVHDPERNLLEPDALASVPRG